MNNEANSQSDLASLDEVKKNSIRASKEGFAVLDQLKTGDLSLAEAAEHSNAIGKVNAANGNLLKADLLALAIDKQNTDRVRRLSHQGEE